MNVKHPALLFLYLVLGTFCSKTFAQETLARQNERITSFHADIKIDSSGLIHVSEKINVYAAGSSHQTLPEVRTGDLAAVTVVLPTVEEAAVEVTAGKKDDVNNCSFTSS